MGANKVDIVFVIDASKSMERCFEKLKSNLRRLILPLNQASFEVELGLLAYHSCWTNGIAAHEHFVLAGDLVEYVTGLYQPQVNRDNYFTTDPQRFLDALDRVVIKGNEHTPQALDLAGDFPFEPIEEARRVIILFTNECLENGLLEREPLPLLPAVLRKLVDRKIALYGFLPASRVAAPLLRLPKSVIREVGKGADCWDQLDFGDVMEQMGKSISVSTLQMTHEPDYQKAVYGEDKWVTITGREDNRDD